MLFFIVQSLTVARLLKRKKIILLMIYCFWEKEKVMFRRQFRVDSTRSSWLSFSFLSERSRERIDEVAARLRRANQRRRHTEGNWLSEFHLIIKTKRVFLLFCWFKSLESRDLIYSLINRACSKLIIGNICRKLYCQKLASATCLQKTGS